MIGRHHRENSMTLESIRNVVVLGAGTMGPGIAATFARRGYATTLSDVGAQQVDKARAGVAFVLDMLREGGIVSAEEATAASHRITLTTDPSFAIAAADFILENVPERLELKRSVYESLAREARPDAILASDTSGIPISQLQSGIANSGRVIGMHWSNPPHLIPVIEVIKGDQTTKATVDTTIALVESLGMVPGIVDRDVPGFVENRILYAIMREALHLLDEGVASAESIDRIVRWGIGYKLGVIGPLELLDVAGLDIYTAVASYLNKDLCNDSGISATVTDKVKAGQLGLKTQGGLFRYEAAQIPALARKRGRALMASRRALMAE
jgi:3-hydroxybutyryl-CoA dehydrogenase/5-formyl-3-hydroxy-2-methylpyridine 4-carboxylate dehydrogenase